MAYLSDFAFDIFISYAHVDNLTASSRSEGWVAQFHRQLEILLWKRKGKRDSVRIWRDPSLDGNQLFDTTIRNRVESSALFLALTSTGYLESDYCRRELQCFSQRTRLDAHGLVVEDRLRIFNVLLNNIPYSKWPEEYGRSSGFEFHDAQNDEDCGYPLDPSHQSFELPLRKLVDAIDKTLSGMKARSRDPAPSGPDPATDLFSVYVADTADSLSTARKRLINELQQKEGISVVSNIPPPYEGGAHERKVIGQLTKSRLSVHLLGEFPGREIEGKPGLCYPQAQSELAIQHGSMPLIWVPQQLDRESIEDPAYNQFLDKLENGSRHQRAYDFIRGPSSSIVREILEKIDSLKASTNTHQDALVPAALLDTHFKDQAYAYSLSQYLLERHVQPYINPEEDDPRKNLKIFQERLKQVSLLIIFFGNVALEWVRERLATAVQIAIAEGCPLKACGVYLAPPRKTSAELQLGPKWLPVELMDNTEGFNAESMNRLLARMT